MMRSWYHAIPRHIGRRQRLRHVSILSVRYRRRRNEENSQRHCGCSKPRTLMKPTYNRNGERQCWCDSCFKFGCSTRIHNGLFSLVTYIDAGALDMDLGCLSCEGARPSHYAQAPPCPQCHAPCGLDYERGCRSLSVWPSFTACTECGFCPSEDPRCSQCHAPCGLSYERGCGWIAAGGLCGECEWRLFGSPATQAIAALDEEWETHH